MAIHKSIVYGSIAFYLGKKSEETKTHRWHIYVRGVNNEDLSYFISKVVITLHQSFANPVRVLTESPFEISELGWGEFDTKIQIYFQDKSLPPVDILHFLKLYPPQSQIPSSKKPVINEYYDELVFNEPSSEFTQMLMAGPSTILAAHPLQSFLPVYEEAKDMQLIASAQRWADEELDVLREKVVRVDIDLKKAKAGLV